MAKRNPPRSQAEDSATAPGAPLRKRAAPRARANGETTSAATGQDQAGAMSDEFLGESGRAEEPVQGEATNASLSMGSEPSEEDIRMRAYQKYLERGGGHGRDYDDWLEAERELKHP